MFKALSLKRKTFLFFIAALGLVLMVGTNPSHLPVAVLLIPFIVLWVLVFFLSMYTFDAFYNKAEALAHRKKILFAFIVASFPTSCLLLQSIGQFSFRDFITLVILVAISLFYTSRIGRL